MAYEEVDREELARQLRRLRERDGLADETRLAEYAPLLLDVTRRLLAIEGERVQAVTPRAIRLLEDASHGLAPDSQRIIAAAFNFTQQTGSTLGKRLARVAEQLHQSEPRHIADRERGLHEPLADFMLEELRVAQSRATHSALARGDGDATAAAMLVVEQFRYYYRIFTPLGALGADLAAWLAYRQRLPDRPTPGSLLDGVIYRLAETEAQLEAFIRDLGGNWILSDPEAETTVVLAVESIERLLPFSEWDHALLRIALDRAPNDNRVAFFSVLAPERLDTRFRRRLRAWLNHCDCNLRRPKKTCEPHRVIRACRTFTTTIDHEWYRLANWYHLPPEETATDRDTVVHYFLHAQPYDFDLSLLDAHGSAD